MQESSKEKIKNKNQKERTKEINKETKKGRKTVIEWKKTTHRGKERKTERTKEGKIK